MPPTMFWTMPVPLRPSMVWETLLSWRVPLAVTELAAVRVVVLPGWKMEAALMVRSPVPGIGGGVVGDPAAGDGDVASAEPDGTCAGSGEAVGGAVDGEVAVDLEGAGEGLEAVVGGDACGGGGGGGGDDDLVGDIGADAELGDGGAGVGVAEGDGACARAGGSAELEHAGFDDGAAEVGVVAAENDTVACGRGRGAAAAAFDDETGGGRKCRRRRMRTTSRRCRRWGSGEWFRG